MRLFRESNDYQIRTRNFRGYKIVVRRGLVGWTADVYAEGDLGNPAKTLMNRNTVEAAFFAAENWIGDEIAEWEKESNG